MIKPILISGNKILRKKSKAVRKFDKKVYDLICDLKDTIVAQTEPEGVGLAAPQIGKNLRVFVMKPNKEITVIINPEIVFISKSTRAPNKQLAKKHKKIMEGCLSLPNYYTPLDRAFFVKIKYLDENGKENIRQFEGLEAQIIQHEIDHLEGKMFIDRMLEQKKTLYEYNKGKWSEVEL